MEGFGGLIPPAHWKALLAEGRPRIFPAGARLMRQGDPADHVLLLVEGRVKVWRDEREGKRITLAVRWPGEALGDRGMYGDQERTASVTAVERCRTVRIEAGAFPGLVRRPRPRSGTRSARSSGSSPTTIPSRWPRSFANSSTSRPSSSP